MISINAPVGDATARSNASANCAVDYLLGVKAIGLGQHDEVRVHDVCAADPRGVVSFLMHADCAVGAVVEQQDDGRCAILLRGTEFLPVHLEVPIACKTHHHAVRLVQLGSDGSRHAGAHATPLAPISRALPP